MAEQLTLLINRSDITPYAQIAIHAREEDMLQPHILAAQNVDIKGALGNPLFTDLINNYTAAKYQTLLNGGTYTDADNNVVSFQGLKAAICCLTYARYIMYKNAIDTPYGLVAKTNDYSEQTNPQLIAKIASDKRNEGSYYLDETIKFINLNAATYDLFDTGKRQSPNKFIHKLTSASKI